MLANFYSSWNTQAVGSSLMSLNHRNISPAQPLSCNSTWKQLNVYLRLLPSSYSPMQKVIQWDEIRAGPGMPDV